MFDIDESNAAATNWATKVKGFGLLDLVIGDVNGNSNVPLAALANRTANLHQRLAPIEQVIGGADPDNIINKLSEVVAAFAGLPESTQLLSLFNDLALNKANRDAANITGVLQLSWRNALNIENKIVRAGKIALTTVNTGNNLYTVFLSSAIPNFNPANHSFQFTVGLQNPFTAGFNGRLNIITLLQEVPTTGNLSSFTVCVANYGSVSFLNVNGFLHYAILENK